MKTRLLKGLAMALALTAILTSTTAIAMASATTDSPSVERTKAWDGITHTLGGVPESVRKIEYQGSIFYLAPSVSDDDFCSVLAVGAESVRLKPPQENGKLYQYPVYILWNSDKTVLLVHPIIFGYDDILEAVAIPSPPPASLMGTQPEAKQTVNSKPKAPVTTTGTTEYMLSAEYADAVRTKFYRILNEYRASKGLRELEVNLELQNYADIRAEEQRTCFGHTRPNGKAAGSGWHNSQNGLNTRYAENAIGVGTLSADPVETALNIFNRWKDSAGHNRHMIYNFDSQITMAFGIAPMLDTNGKVTSGAIFATGY